MEGFPVSSKIQVRWRDLDAMGHVNNAVYFTYWEIARGVYLDRVFADRSAAATSFVVAAIRCDFLAQITSREELEVGIRMSRVGRSSFDFEYELRGTDGRRVATAASTQVLFDYRAQTKVLITEEWLETVAKTEGRRPEGAQHS